MKPTRQYSSGIIPHSFRPETYTLPLGLKLSDIDKRSCSTPLHVVTIENIHVFVLKIHVLYLCLKK